MQEPVDPVIDIRRLKPDTVITLETTRRCPKDIYSVTTLGNDEPEEEIVTQVIELVILKPADGVVRVCGTDKSLRTPTIGRLHHSVNPVTSEQTPHSVVQGSILVIGLKNSTFTSDPVTSATVRGKGWHYDVFGETA